MRYSKLFCPTIKEVPKEAEIASHQLMLRAGLVRKISSGIYSYLPLGLRVIKKFENIVREELNKAGCQEVLFPVIIPADLWLESGRWEKYGKELLRIKDRNNKEFCFGPTHEEVVTDLIRKNIKSYKQLPLILYQIQNKFRDEIRPRFGIMRSREFGMKDAYSFHETEECLDKTYKAMIKTYCRIFERCGLNFKIVQADSGSIGGNVSAEFMVTANTGEDAIIECSSCSYTANIEAAELAAPEDSELETPVIEYSEVHTPDLKTVKQTAAFFKVSEKYFIKTLIYLADQKPVAVLIRGSDSINEIKLRKALNCEYLNLADDETVQKVTGAPAGFAGPVNLNFDMIIIADYSIKASNSFYTGANKKDYHLKNVVIKRDFKPGKYVDIRNAKESDPCSKCTDGHYRLIRGIEAGHVFQLGKKYSEAMSASFLDSSGKEKIMTMGCYGIGTGRTVAAAIEQNYDSNGIIWPLSLAPYHVDIILTNKKEPVLTSFAEKLYQLLIDENIEVIFDDRDESAGKKFKDAELIGFPVQLIIGRKLKDDGLVEMKIRSTNKVYLIPEENILKKIRQVLSNES